MAQAYHSVGTAQWEAYQAVTRGAGVLDRSGAAGRLGVSGADRADWLQGLVTNDVKALEPGGGCYAAYLTPQGRMLADMRILALDDAFLMDVPAEKIPFLLERFDQFIITEDVRVWDQTNEVRRLAVHGPDAPRVLARAVGADEARLTAMSEHQHVRSPWASVDLVIAGSRDLGASGFDVYVPPSHGSELEAAMLQAGAAPLDEGTWHTLRVEAGRPLYGVDMNEETIPLEAGIDGRAISLTKGCYVGQEVIIRVLHRGHGRVARKLVRLIETPDEASPTSPERTVGSEPRFARDAVIATSGREVGRVTSAAWSPAIGRSIGLGYVRRELAEAGTKVTILAGDQQHIEASVMPAEAPL